MLIRRARHHAGLVVALVVAIFAIGVPIAGAADDDIIAPYKERISWKCTQQGAMERAVEYNVFDEPPREGSDCYLWGYAAALSGSPYMPDSAWGEMMVEALEQGLPVDTVWDTYGLAPTPPDGIPPRKDDGEAYMGWVPPRNLRAFWARPHCATLDRDESSHALQRLLSRPTDAGAAAVGTLVTGCIAYTVNLDPETLPRRRWVKPQELSSVWKLSRSEARFPYWGCIDEAWTLPLGPESLVLARERLVPGDFVMGCRGRTVQERWHVLGKVPTSMDPRISVDALIGQTPSTGAQMLLTSLELAMEVVPFARIAEKSLNRATSWSEIYERFERYSHSRQGRLRIAIDSSAVLSLARMPRAALAVLGGLVAVETDRYLCVPDSANAHQLVLSIVAAGFSSPAAFFQRSLSRFQPHYFPESVLAKHSTGLAFDHCKRGLTYSEWAALEANAVAYQLARGRGPAAVYRDTVTSRRQYQIANSTHELPLGYTPNMTPNGRTVGKWRNQPLAVDVSALPHELVVYQLEAIQYAMTGSYHSRVGAWFKEIEVLPGVFAHLHYWPKTGQIILQHPGARTVPRIMDEVWQRVEHILGTPGPRIEKKRELLEAMWLATNGQPLEAGNQAVHRSFFAALGRGINEGGRLPSFGTYFDLDAFFMPKKEFVTKYLQRRYWDG